jgi:hypothetical protein
MVEDITKNCLTQGRKADKTSGNRPINRQVTSASKSNCSSNVENVAKTSLRKLINQRISSESNGSKCHIETSQKTLKPGIVSTEHGSSSSYKEYAGSSGQEGNGERSVSMETPHFLDRAVPKKLHLTIPDRAQSPHTEDMSVSTELSPSEELSLDQCSLLLDLLGTDQLAKLQTEAESDLTSASLPSPSPSEDRWSSSTLSPLSVTTNMLEGLLRRSDGSPSSSKSHSLENSIDCTENH